MKGKRPTVRHVIMRFQNTCDIEKILLRFEKEKKKSPAPKNFIKMTLEFSVTTLDVKRH